MAGAKAAESKPAPQRDLAPASTASDPEVHHLLAQRTALEQWDAQQRAAIDAAQKEINERREQYAAIDKRLAQLGYR